MQKRSIVTSIVAASALTVGALAGASGAGAAPSTKAVPNSTPAWTAKVKPQGKASSTAAVKFRVYLAPNGGTDALKAAVAKASKPGTATFRKFMTSTGYHAKYDPTAATVSSMKSWLASNSLKVTGVAAHNNYLQVSGTVAAAQKAFGTTIQNYVHNGVAVQANSTALNAPTSIVGQVLAIDGLDTTPHKIKADSAPEPDTSAVFVNARPCSKYYGQIQAKYQADYHTPLPKYNGQTLSYVPCGYTGPQYRAAYEHNTATTGAGITVAITDAYASPTAAYDSNNYAERNGDGSYVSGQYTESLPSSFNSQDVCGPDGWAGEETLDIEAVHAMAPGANVLYYGSPSCYDNDFADTLQRVADDDIAQIVTNSWSDLEQNENGDQVAVYEDIFLQGALEGITFMFSSGDNGDELANSALRQVDYPASDPYVTGVGGTSVAINSGGTFSFQTGWGTERSVLSADGSSWTPTGFLYGAGGGTSTLFNRPDYQAGVVPETIGGGRAVPDISMDADPQTGMLIGQTQQFPDGTLAYSEYRIGGTSLASPLLAGMLAVLDSHAGGGLGFLNPLIYDQAGSSAFRDIKGNPGAANQGVVRVNYNNSVDATGGINYSVRTFNQDSSLAIAPGWDDVTGVGSPTASWLTSINPASS